MVSQDYVLNKDEGKVGVTVDLSEISEEALWQNFLGVHLMVSAH